MLFVIYICCRVSLAQLPRRSDMRVSSKSYMPGLSLENRIILSDNITEAMCMCSTLN